MRKRESNVMQRDKELHKRLDAARASCLVLFPNVIMHDKGY